MKCVLLFAFLISLAFVAKADELSDCKCWEGYQAQKNDQGVVECVGIQLFHILPCNTPRQPKCKCGSGVTGILSDKTGTWCTIYKDGKEIKRWACENPEEWREYYEQHPNEKPKA